MLAIEVPRYERLRLTIPAKEALLQRGNIVEEEGCTESGVQLYSVCLERPPRQVLVVERTPSEGADLLSLRCHNEPAYPQATKAAWWEQGDWVPCPSCGAALVWFEAGYVPGWRLCLNGHASRLSRHGTYVRRKPDHDKEAEPA